MKRKSAFLGLTVLVFWGSNWILRAQPASSNQGIGPAESAEPAVATPINFSLLAAEDDRREKLGGPYRFAIRKPVEVTPGKDGTWEALDEGTLLWRLPVVSPGALSLSFGFSRYVMPPGGRLHIYSADRAQVLGPFTDADNREHGQLWTPLLYSHAAILELSIPAIHVSKLQLELTSVNHGYRALDPLRLVDRREGSRGILARADWQQGRGSTAAVGTFHLTRADGSYASTGVLVNNTARDRRPYFLLTFGLLDASQDSVLDDVEKAAAASLVVYWNLPSSPGAEIRLSGAQRQSGATFRAGDSAAGLALVELDDAPAADSGVYYSGWDRTETSASEETVTIQASGASQDAPSASDLVPLHTSWAAGETPDTRLRDWLDPLGAAPPFLEGLSAADDACTDITIGTGTLSWDYPFHTSNSDSRTQVIYLAREIGRGGRITRLALDVTKVPGQTLNKWTIRMKHTKLPAHDKRPLESSNWTVVYRKNETITTTGWHWFELQTPFDYDGTRNLMVDFSHNNTGSTSDGLCRASQPGGLRSGCAYSDSEYAEPLNWSLADGLAVAVDYVPNLRLTVCPFCVDRDIGTGAVSWEYPLHVGSHDSRTQAIYRAGEIGRAGRITSLALDVAQVPGQTLSKWTIRMKHTQRDTYDTNSLDAADWTIVYQKDETITATGWRWFELRTPFNYDGASNLLIDFSHNNTSSTSNGLCRASQPGGARSLCASSDSQQGDPLNWSGAVGSAVLSDYVPNLRLTVCQSGANRDIGGGSLDWDYPLHTSFPDSRTQVIYLAQEIDRVGRITRLALNVAQAPEQTLQKWTIRMKTTALLMYDTCGLDAASWTVVYRKDETISTTGWHWFELQTPFDYDGTKNLLVDFSHHNTSATSNGLCSASQPPGATGHPSDPRSICAYSYGAGGDPLIWSGEMGSASCSHTVPDIKLTICQVAAWAPPTTRPGSATQCQAVPTQCPTVATECRPTDTICPPRETQCPEVATRCPETPSFCRTVWTYCSTEYTQCPVSSTSCPRTSTQCPYQRTRCPTIETSCPRVYTKCGNDFTWCPDKPCTLGYLEVPASATPPCPTLEVSCPSVVAGKR